MILVLLAALASPPSAKNDLVIRDARALEAAHASEITQPAVDCIKARFDSHKAAPAEKGDAKAALSFASEQVQNCGLEKVRTKLEAALRHSDRTATEGDIKRRADQQLGLIAAVASIRAMDDFEVRMPEPPAISIPVPPLREGKPQ